MLFSCSYQNFGIISPMRESIIFNIALFPHKCCILHSGLYCNMEELLSTKVSCCFVVFFFTPSSAPPTNVLIPTQTLIYENLERVFGLYRGNRFTLSSVHINVCWLGTHSTHGAHGVSSSRKGRMCLDAHGSYHYPVFVVAHFLYS